ncbi:MAG: chromate transporter [Clostridia bacterium]|nr:chromate transporter [Clostridia bacterium]
MWKLIVSFFKIGLFTFGGGYAMLPVIEREITDKRQWCSTDELLDCYAIAQCTPGVIAVNTATFIGYKIKGAWGGVVATAAVVSPSLIIISIIAAFIQNFAGLSVVQHGLAGIRIAVSALVINTLIKMFRKSVKGATGVLIFLAALALTLFMGISPLYIVLGAIAVGLLLGALQKGGRQ